MFNEVVITTSTIVMCRVVCDLRMYEARGYMWGYRNVGNGASVLDYHSSVFRCRIASDVNFGLADYDCDV